jgi:hypothetical protein
MGWMIPYDRLVMHSDLSELTLKTRLMDRVDDDDPGRPIVVFPSGRKYRIFTKRTHFWIWQRRYWADSAYGPAIRVGFDQVGPYTIVRVAFVEPGALASVLIGLAMGWAGLDAVRKYGQWNVAGGMVLMWVGVYVICYLFYLFERNLAILDLRELVSATDPDLRLEMPPNLQKIARILLAAYSFKRNRS